MLQAPTAESLGRDERSRKRDASERERTLDPRLTSPGATYENTWSETGAPGTTRPRKLAGLHRTIGNQAVLRLLRSAAEGEAKPNSHPPRPRAQLRPGIHPRRGRQAAQTDGDGPAAGSGVAIQCQSSTTPKSIDGEDLPQFSTHSAGGGGENVEDPDLALAQIEAGTPSAEQPQPTPGPETGAPREEEAGVVQTAAAPFAAPPGSISPKAILAQLGSGEPLRASLLVDLGTRLGRDFGNVRVHHNPAAAVLAVSLGAHAFTVGEHIAFAPGRYQPETAGSRRLIAHELAHVIQQRRGLSGSILGRGIGSANDRYEREAEAVADRVSLGIPSSRAGEPNLSSAPSADVIAVQCFSGSSAASYARSWATKTNPAYLRFGDDCTNFISQAMEAGGWSYLFGSDVCDDRKKDSVWWFKKDGCERTFLPNVNASFTWGGAHNFYHFAGGSGRATAAANVTDLEEGDVLQRDHGDGHIHHSMVVTKKGVDTIDGKPNMIQIWLSYHTNDTLDRKFWGAGNILDTTPDGWKYFGWKIK